MGRKAQSDWYRLYRAIKPRVDAFDGEESIHQFIRSEAHAVKYNEKGVKRMLSAGKFLDEIGSGPVSEDSVNCGYAHIEILSRIHKIDPKRAEALLAPVLDNQMTVQQLQDTLAGCSNVGGGQITARSRARRRITEHKKLVFQLAEHMGPGFFGAPDAEMVLVNRFGSLGQFILLNDPEKPIAIIPRLGDSSQKESRAAEDLVKLALANRPYFYRIWLVLPGDSLLAREVAGQAHELGALGNWLHLAIPDEDSASLVPFKNLSQLLENKMWGMPRFEWAGVSLLDGRPRNGWLDPRNK